MQIIWLNYKVFVSQTYISVMQDYETMYGINCDKLFIHIVTVQLFFLPPFPYVGVYVGLISLHVAEPSTDQSAICQLADWPSCRFLALHITARSLETR